MKRYGLIGERLGHSHSKTLHGYLADYSYDLWPMPKEAVDGFLKSDQYDGMNVTIPYKQTVIPYLEEMGETARAVGAVNTIVRQSDGSLYGDNTDVYGMSVMAQRAQMDFAGKKTVILGSGGTAKTVKACLQMMGAKQVTVVSRHPEGEGQISYADFYEVFPQTGGTIVNASSAGMWPRQDEDNICAIHPSRVDEMMQYALGVADVVYNPSHTFLTKAAERAGIPWCTGLYMLVAQAVEAEKIWQGIDIPDELVPKIMGEVKI